MIYNKRMTEIRNENNMKQEEISSILNIERGVYSLYETEYVIIPLKHLITFCDYFNISLDYIMNFSNVKNYNNSKKADINISGNRIKEFRKENKLTQKKLAEKLNIASTMVSKYEKGEYIISTHALYDICKKYHISADYLLGKIEYPKYLSNNNK